MNSMIETGGRELGIAMSERRMNEKIEGNS